MVVFRGGWHLHLPVQRFPQVEGSASLFCDTCAFNYNVQKFVISSSYCVLVRVWPTLARLSSASGSWDLIQIFSLEWQCFCLLKPLDGARKFHSFQQALYC